MSAQLHGQASQPRPVIHQPAVTSPLVAAAHLRAGREDTKESFRKSGLHSNTIKFETTQLQVHARRRTTLPRCLRTRSGISRTASLMEQNTTPALLSSSLNVVAMDTESKTASMATFFTFANRFCGFYALVFMSIKPRGNQARRLLLCRRLCRRKADLFRGVRLCAGETWSDASTLPGNIHKVASGRTCCSGDQTARHSHALP